MNVSYYQYSVCRRNLLVWLLVRCLLAGSLGGWRREVKIHQRGVQWKQGVVVYIILQAVLLYNTTPIHCTPLRLHPPAMNTQEDRGKSSSVPEKPSVVIPFFKVLRFEKPSVVIPLF